MSPKTKGEETMQSMKVKLTTTYGMLGTASADPELHEKFIASKSADKEAARQELESLPADEIMDKTITVFHRDGSGNPILYDYQIKGFIKEALGVQVEFSAIELQKKPAVKLSRYTYKRIVDNFVFVYPRQIKLKLPVGGQIGTCTRPLRAVTMRGERVALATSEEAPAGTVLECEIRWLNPKLGEIIKNCMNYGSMKGLGQWRNSGKGRFEWEEVE